MAQPIFEVPAPVAGSRLALIVRGVTKTFPAQPAPVQALSGVDLTVTAGSLSAILGASGCGKTTLLRVIAGFDRPDSGRICLGERVLSAPGVQVPPEQRGIGIVPQEGALFPHLDVAQNIGFGLSGWGFQKVSSRRRRQRAERIAELLELVGLPDYGRRRPDELSGGQQQRVALARALAPRPPVILLDEPFAALDVALRAELREEVRDLLRRLGATALLVTHDHEEALSLADHVAVMRDGQIVQADSPRGLYGWPRDAQIATFTGETVLLSGCLVTDVATPAPWVECALGRVAVRAAGDSPSGLGECLVMLRPEQLEIAETGTPARVMSTSFFGRDGIVRLRLGSDGIGPEVLVRVLGDALPAVDELVAVRVVAGAYASVMEPAGPAAS